MVDLGVTFLGLYWAWAEEGERGEEVKVVLGFLSDYPGILVPFFAIPSIFPPPSVCPYYGLFQLLLLLHVVLVGLHFGEVEGRDCLRGS